MPEPKPGRRMLVDLRLMRMSRGRDDLNANPAKLRTERVAEVGQAQKTGYPNRTSVLAKVAEKEAIPLLMWYFLGMQGRTDAGASEG